MTIAEKLVDIAERVPMVFDAGKEAEQESFWNSFQKNGTLTDYNYSLGGVSCNDDTYNPKYTIIADKCVNMFRSALITDTKVDIDARNSTGANYVFNNAANLVRVPKLIVSENTNFTGWFAYCNKLEEIKIEGIIDNNFDIHWSKKLSMPSLASIVGALSKTVTGQSITLPTTARQTYDDATVAGRWDEIRLEHMNWSFNYA